jgi:membrane protein
VASTSETRGRRQPVAAFSERSRAWADRQDPSSATGVGISAWRHYRSVDGPLQSALLSLYVLVAVVPALLVLEAFLDPHPDALAHSIIHHFRLNDTTATLLAGVLGEGRSHELGSALLAIAGALFFGLGFGKVLQLVHVRAWQLALRPRPSDQALYGLVLVGLYGLIFVLLLQLKELSGRPLWVGWTLAVGWVVVLVAFFTWAPWLLGHRLIPWRSLLPAALLTAVGLVLLMLVSRYVMQFWVNLYARDYGGFGVVLALYFWIAISSALIVWAASLAPALAERRELRALVSG